MTSVYCYAVWILINLWGKGSGYWDANSIYGASSSLHLSERVGTVNNICGTSARMTAQFNAVYAHEQGHVSSYNARLASTKAVQTITKIEAIVGATGTVTTVI